MQQVKSPLHRSLIALGLAWLLLAAPAGAQVTEDDVEEAKRIQEEAAAERAAALADLDEAIAAYEEIRGELEQLTFRMAQMRSRIEDYQAATRTMRDEIANRAVESYMRGKERDPVARAFSSESVQQVIIARQVLALAVENQTSALDDLEASTAQMERLQEDLDTDTARAKALRLEAEAIANRMNELFDEAQVQYDTASDEFEQVSEALAEQRRKEEEERRRREEEERLRQAALQAAGNPAAGVPAWVTPDFQCPVAGPNAFRDTWGAPRSGGRSHRGVDMMAARGAPLVAVGSGTVTRSYGVLGGNIVWLHADHGVSYFYAHLDSYPDGFVNGMWVQRGQVIGYTGDTGNPAPGAYHLHFGIYPGGTGAVNPYPTVQRACQG